MSHPDEAAPGILGHQSLRRPLTCAEVALAQALEEIFSTGQHELAAVVEYLQQHQVVRPSGTAGPWTLEVLQEELERINTSLDDAYLNRGNVAAGR